MSRRPPFAWAHAPERNHCPLAARGCRNARLGRARRPADVPPHGFLWVPPRRPPGRIPGSVGPDAAEFFGAFFLVGSPRPPKSIQASGAEAAPPPSVGIGGPETTDSVLRREVLPPPVCGMPFGRRVAWRTGYP